MGYALVWLVNSILSLMIWAIIISAILSWLFAFDVINARNRFVGQIAHFLDSVTGPILAPFRRVIPPLGGIDLSPIVAILLIQFLSVLFNRMSAPFLIMTLG
jgi:YggT family protein